MSQPSDQRAAWREIARKHALFHFDGIAYWEEDDMLTAIAEAVALERERQREEDVRLIRNATEPNIAGMQLFPEQEECADWLAAQPIRALGEGKT